MPDQKNAATGECVSASAPSHRQLGASKIKFVEGGEWIGLDGKVLWISGEFEIVERPNKLVYTWRLGSEVVPLERVTVTFEAHGVCTEVIIVHVHIPTLIRETYIRKDGLVALTALWNT